jgi:hypothetical protein
VHGERELQVERAAAHGQLKLPLHVHEEPIWC